MARWLDAEGTSHPRARAQPRIVSLVPSVTELLCELGLREQLVGRTGFCIHPKDSLREVPKVGDSLVMTFNRDRNSNRYYDTNLGRMKNAYVNLGNDQ